MTSLGDQIIARARSYIGKLHDGSDVVAIGTQLAGAYPENATYFQQATTTMPWCGAFIAKVLTEIGIKIPGPRNGIGPYYVDWWEGFGAPVPVADRQPGDIALYLARKSSMHHITFVSPNGYIGGNQSDGVNEQHYGEPDEVRRAPQPGAVVVLAPSAPTKRNLNITATVFSSQEGNQTTAYADVGLGWDARPGVALPWRFTGTRPQVRVINNATGKSVVCAIIDQGPWNYTGTNKPGDPYWQTGARPQAESGTDQSGRHTNSAGIDLTPAAASAIGINGKGLVDWEFVGDEVHDGEVLPPLDPSQPQPFNLSPIIVALIALLFKEKSPMTDTAGQTPGQSPLEALLPLILQMLSGNKTTALPPPVAPTPPTDSAPAIDPAALQNLLQKLLSNKGVTLQDLLPLVLPIVVMMLQRGHTAAPALPPPVAKPADPVPLAPPVAAPVTPPTPETQPSLGNPIVKTSAWALAASSLLQVFGVVAPPIGDTSTMTGTLATVIPLVTGAISAVGGFGPLINIGLKLFGAFAASKKPVAGILVFFLAGMLLTVPTPATSGEFDKTVLRVKQALWPRHYAGIPTPPARPPDAEPIPIKVDSVPPPDIVKPKPSDKSPTVIRAPPKQKAKHAAALPKKIVVAQAPKTKDTGISSAVCAEIAVGIGIYGRDGVRRKARERGYTNSQIAAAQSACGY